MEKKEELKTIEDVKTYEDFVRFTRANMVLCNNIVNIDENLFGNVENGEIAEGDEIFQYYIIDNNTYINLRYFTNEIVFYSELLDTYVWGIDHYGTAWDYVNIDLKNNKI